MSCLVAELCPTLCDPMDCSPPGSSVHEILQARILERVAISFSRDSSDPGMEPKSPALAGGCFTTERSGKPVYVFICVLFFLLLITFLLFVFSAAVLWKALVISLAAICQFCPSEHILVPHLQILSTCNAGYLGSIPGLGRTPGEGKGYPPQYSGLENSMDYSP